MKILTRYVLLDLVKVFLLILIALTLAIFILLVGKEAVDKGLGLGPLLRMVPYLLPQAMQFAVPATMLLATTYVYGRMSSYNEIVAIKALGISPMTVIWPALALATLVSFAGVALNDLAVSWGRNGLERVFIESIEEVAYRQLRVNRNFTIGPWTITVRRVDGHKLIQPMFVEQPSSGRRGQLALAEEAELFAFPDEGKLLVRLRNGEVESPLKAIHPDWFELEIDYSSFVGSHARSPSNYALREIGPAVESQRERMEDIAQSMTAQAGFAMLTGNFDALAADAWQPFEKEMSTARQRLYRLHTEPWRRWANGFSCLCFVLVGAPLAVWLRHAEFLAIFFACFLPILLVYYPLIAATVDQAKDGVLPPPSVWLGNFVLALIGGWLLRRVIRY